MRVYLCAIICSWLFLCSAGAGISDEVVLALAPFDFIDTSGETRSQVAEHKHRLELFHATVEAAVSALGAIQRLPCNRTSCSVNVSGIEILSKQAIEQNASLLLIGQIKKMSTLVGQVKFAVIDLKTNQPLCDRYITYRGDSDEAWRRAARFLVKDLAANCLKM